MTKAERLQWWTDNPEGVPSVKLKHVTVRGPLGISPVVANGAKSALQMWPRYLQSAESSTESGCSDDSDSGFIFNTWQ